MATQVCVVGTVATDPKVIDLKSGVTLCTFRLASGERRFNRETKEWEDGETTWFSVNAFRALANNAKASFAKGDRIIVTGKLRVKSWERDERSGTSVEIDAEALGHELRWGTSVFSKSRSGDEDGTRTSEAPKWAAEAPRTDVPSAERHVWPSDGSESPDHDGEQQEFTRERLSAPPISTSSLPA